MMKKRTALTLLTATMMVSAAAGTYAQWDKLDDTKAKTLEFRKPINVAMKELSTTITDPNNTDPNTKPVAKGTLDLDINTAGVADQLVLTPTITEKKTVAAQGESVESTIPDLTIEDFDITINDIPVSSVGHTFEGIVDGENSYTISIEPKDEKSMNFDANMNTVDLEIKAELKKKPVV